DRGLFGAAPLAPVSAGGPRLTAAATRPREARPDRSSARRRAVVFAILLVPCPRALPKYAARRETGRPAARRVSRNGTGCPRGCQRLFRLDGHLRTTCEIVHGARRLRAGGAGAVCAPSPCGPITSFSTSIRWSSTARCAPSSSRRR